MEMSAEVLCDEQEFEKHLDELAARIALSRRKEVPLRLVGVRTRGVPIAVRIAERLSAELGIEVPVGAVDITLYRDDLTRSQRWPVLRGTNVPFDVDGAEIVLVDDVLYTGRTIRAALNAVCDLGRPAVVKLAVVVDRGGRELPIAPDFVGMAVTPSPESIVRVQITPHDPRNGIFSLPRPTPTSTQS